MNKRDFNTSAFRDSIKNAFGLSDFNEYNKYDVIDQTAQCGDPPFSQWDVMLSILRGKDTFAIIPTGGGKSVCYQAPSLFFEGVTIVVSPLVALIEDQVSNFNKKMHNNGMEFRAIFPEMDGMSTSDLLDRVKESCKENSEIRYKLIYLSPERLDQPKFIRFFLKSGIKVDHVVIDEAHCLSHWGFDFRESYLNIARFIKKLPDRPVISAFTATATSRDIFQIKKILGLGNNRRKDSFFRSVEKRKNLKIEFRSCQDGQTGGDTRFSVLMDILNENKEKKILIYRTTVVGVEELYKDLSKQAAFVAQQGKLGMYHGEMNLSSRKTNAKRFGKTGKKNIMIATKAFGMGIDIPDIEMIIHYDVPMSIEEYYQEIGRAARAEGSSAECILLYNKDSKEDEKYVRGCESWTKEWVNSNDCVWEREKDAITSKLSVESKKMITDRAGEKLKKVIDYCQYLSKNKAGGTELDPVVEYMKEVFNPTPEFEHFMTELNEVLEETNEFHVNNCYIANLMRWHPDEYTLDEEYSERKHYDVSFTLYGKDKPDYFDMCVADAVYSIILTDTKIIYTKTVWEVLSGNRNAKFSRSESKSKNPSIKERIENSLDKLIGLKISIMEGGKEVAGGSFLPLQKRNKDLPGKLGYDVLSVPPLYRYAEEMNGELIRFPTSLLNVKRKINNKTYPFPIHWEGCNKKTVSEEWGYSIENAVLAHYILHRLHIWKHSRRGENLSFGTLVHVLWPFLNQSKSRGRDYLQKKIFAMVYTYSLLGLTRFDAYRFEKTDRGETNRARKKDYSIVQKEPEEGKDKAQKESKEGKDNEREVYVDEEAMMKMDGLVFYGFFNMLD